jgi:hypothetical protein
VEGWLNTVEKPESTPYEQWLQAAHDMNARVEAAKQNPDPSARNTAGAFEDYRLSALLPLGDDFYLALFGEYSLTAGSWVGKQVFHRTNGEWKVTAYVPRKRDE